MKKLLASILAICLVLSSMTVVFAEGKTIEVATKAELDLAIASAKDGDTILLTADIDYTGAASLEINNAVVLDLGGKTLTTNGTYGGLRLKGNCSLKNGTLAHKGTVTAIKAWNIATIENVVIDVAFKAEGKIIGGIVIQNESTVKIDTMKNVTIKGDGLTNGIETYNCGDATQDVIGSMENVTIDAKGTGMLISAPCGTATNCTVSGGVTGIEIWIKGTYSASLDLVNCDVDGGKQTVYVHDEFSSNPDIVNNGTLEFTADEATTYTSENGALLTKTIARAENVDIEDVEEVVLASSTAKIGDTYYTTFADAVAAAQSGDEVKILVPGTYSIPTGKNITITGGVDGVVFECGQNNIGMNGANVTFNNVTFNWASNGWPYHGLAHSGNLVYNNCTVNGTVFLYGASDTFNKCTFNVTGDTYNVWTYGSKKATFNNCKFYSDGKSVLIYKEGTENENVDQYASFTPNAVSIENCEFYASSAATGKAAVEIDTSLFPMNVAISNSSAIGFDNGSVSGDMLWNVKKQFANTEALLTALGTAGYNNSLTLNNKEIDLVAYTNATEESKPVIAVEFVKADVDAAGVDTIEDADVYNVVLKSDSKINRLNSVDLTFDFDTNDKMAYEVIKVDNITVSTDADFEHRYMFNYNGKEDNVVDSGETLTIGKIKVTGYGTYTLAVDEDKTNVANATTLANNIVDTYLSKGAVAGQGVLNINDSETATIKVPTRELTVKVTFPNVVVDKASTYQNMSVTISGGDLAADIVKPLGSGTNANASYTVTADLTLNTAYTVTVKGDGYRTARYTVTMTGDKTLNFWNNVMDNKMEVEEGKASSAAFKNFLAGDIVADNNINIYDLSAVVSYFTQDATKDAKYIKYDLNRDGVIDSKDVAYVLVSWGE